MIPSPSRRDDDELEGKRLPKVSDCQTKSSLMPNKYKKILVGVADFECWVIKKVIKKEAGDSGFEAEDRKG